jgi:PAS domain S-box-containing protein
MIRTIRSRGTHTGKRQYLPARVAPRIAVSGAQDDLTHLLSESPMVMYRGSTSDHRISYVSPNVGEVLGYEPDEALGVAYFLPNLMHPDDRETFYANLDESLGYLGPGSHVTDFRLLHKDGDYRWVQALVHFALDAEGNRVGLLGYLLDITERKREQDELRQLIAASPTIKYRARLPDFTPTYLSPNFTQLLGYPPEAVLGVPFFMQKHMHPDDRGDVRAAIEKTIGGSGAATHVREFRLRHQSGDYRWMHAMLRYELSATGDRVGVLGYLLDISERKVAQQALQAAKIEAERANRAKSHFLSRMSHELRTPLNAILGFAELMEMEPRNDADRKALQRIRQGGKHLLELVNEVLDISRIESEQLALSPEAVDVSDALKQAIALMQPLARGRNVRIQRRRASATCCVSADRQRLKQVLLNLLGNAVKYNRTGGRVTVSWEVQGGTHVSILVADTGMGIAPERLSRLFTPFDRLGAEQTGVEGTGLGLTVSKHLVEAMGGTIAAESTAGKGSTFRIMLPLAQVPDPALAEPGANCARIISRKSTPASVVLSIEDNLSNAELIEGMLAHRPETTVLAAAEGKAGIDLARECVPDAILLDLHLPDIAGAEVLRRLRSEPLTRNIPVMMMTADATPHQAEQLLAAGAQAYLTKPIQVAPFLETLDRLLRLPRPPKP